MRTRLILAALFVFAFLSCAGGSSAETEQVGNLRITFNGGFAPRALPRHELAPIAATVEGTIATTDGTHPPALRRVKIAINRSGKLSAVGLPVCPSASLQSTSSEAALEACRPALVGRGSLRADVSFSGQPAASANGTILAFNSTQNGHPSLLLHLYVTVPVRTTLVLPLIVSHPGGGRFGTLLSGAIPKLAGGLGSITHIELKLGRQYRYKGVRRSYLEASCGAPAGFTLGTFPFVRGSFLFGGGHRFNPVLTRSCRVR